MDGQQAKKFKPEAICIICCEEALYSEKSELYSTFLTEQLIPRSQKNLFHKLFDFCADCIEVIEYLHQLHYDLDFILQSMKQKNTEIRIKILKSKHEFPDEEVSLFRKISIRDLCPSVQMNKNNKLYKDENLQDAVSELSPVKHIYTKKPENEESGKNVSNCQKLLSKNKDESSYFESEDSSDQLRISSCRSLALDETYNGNEIRPDMVCIESTQSMSFKGEELAAKFEPWKEYYSEDDEESTGIINCDSLDSGCNNHKMREPLDELSFDEEDSTICYELSDDEENESNANYIFDGASQMTSVGDDSTNFEHGSKQWDKPALTYLELTILAIMTSKNMQQTFSEICDFISENFPCFQNDKGKGCKWKNGLRCRVATSAYITGFRSDGPRTYLNYVVSNCEGIQLIRKRIQDKLKDENILRSMAFPERISTFQNTIMINVPELSSYFQENIPDNSIHNLEAENANFKESNESPEMARKTSDNLVGSDESVFTKSVSLLIRQNIKIWPKPPFTATELGILAIMSSDHMQMKISEICDFVSYNFPYYGSYNCVDKWKQYLMYSVWHCRCLTGMPSSKVIGYSVENSELSYAVKYCDHYCQYRKQIYDKLTLDLSKYMAIPEKIPSFRELLMRDIPVDSTRDNDLNSDTRNGDDSFYVNGVGENYPNCKKDEMISKTNERLTQYPKDWTKPPLTSQEMCLLAIMSNKYMRMKAFEIRNFISHNFPYFNANNLHGNWKAGVATALCICPFITGMKNRPSLGDKSYFVYVVIKSDIYFRSRKKLHEKLTRQAVSESMAFPEKLAVYRYSLMREIPDTFPQIEDDSDTEN